MTEALVREAWAEVDRLRAFIKSIEWSGAAITGYDGFTTPCCPSCGGFQPTSYTENDSEWQPTDWDHQPECKLVAALATATETGSKVVGIDHGAGVITFSPVTTPSEGDAGQGRES